jgi:hypothetical protein
MKNQEQDRLKKLLQQALPPVEDSGCNRDLWPDLLRTMDQQSTRIFWLDWALGALLAGWMVLYPGGILRLLFHL